jgi:hypothetical protein
MKAALLVFATCSAPATVSYVPPAPPPPIAEPVLPIDDLLPSVWTDPCCTAIRGVCPTVPACEVVPECREVDCCRLGTYVHAPPREWASCDGGWR